MSETYRPVNATCTACDQTWVVNTGAEHLQGIRHSMIGGHTLSTCQGTIQIHQQHADPTQIESGS